VRKIDLMEDDDFGSLVRIEAALDSRGCFHPGPQVQLTG